MSIRRLKRSFCSDTLGRRLNISTDVLICSNLSKRLVWETTMPKILVAGQDIHLLGTRAAVLAKTGADVISCLGAKTVGMVKSERPDLLVLCHSLLSDNDAESIADEIRACCKATKILMVLSELGSELPVQDAKFDAICPPNPERLIVLANELLGGIMPHATQAVKSNGASTGQSGLSRDYRM
jgi:hypothetical protein